MAAPECPLRPLPRALWDPHRVENTATSTIMNARVIVPIMFACVFGSGLLGFLLGKVLPERHLTSASKEIVQLATGLTATLAALALGLLVSSAKGTFDQVGNELTEMAGKVVLLDRVLARYGPATTAIRADLKSIFSRAIEDLASGEVGAGTAPDLISLSRSTGSVSVVRTAWLSLATIAGGVLAGANRAYQLSAIVSA